MIYALFLDMLTSWLIFGAFEYSHQVGKTYHSFYAAQNDGRFIPWVFVRYSSFIASIPCFVLAVLMTVFFIFLGALSIIAHIAAYSAL